jgi:hypothetical protein
LEFGIKPCLRRWRVPLSLNLFRMDGIDKRRGWAITDVIQPLSDAGLNRPAIIGYNNMAYTRQGAESGAS